MVATRAWLVEDAVGVRVAIAQEHVAPPLVSSGTRFEANDMKATKRPVADMAGIRLLLLAWRAVGGHADVDDLAGGLAHGRRDEQGGDQPRYAC